MSLGVAIPSRPACERASDLWDRVIDGFLRGEPTNESPPLDRWFRAYNGRGRGEIDLTCFPEPYLGDLLGQPRAAILALNPGGVRPEFQSRSGTFSEEIRHEYGSYRKWAKSWPYLRKPWGRNSHHDARMAFLQRWFAEPTFPKEHRIDFELFPWHSTAVTGAIRPEPDVVREYIWEPLKELRVEFIFAFGSHWLNLVKCGLFPDIKVVDCIGEGGRSYATSRKAGSATSVLKATTPWGGSLIVEKHAGSAGPPSAEETAIIKKELGFS